jgi:hypothetical protein
MYMILTTGSHGHRPRLLIGKFSSSTTNTKLQQTIKKSSAISKPMTSGEKRNRK